MLIKRLGALLTLWLPAAAFAGGVDFFKGSWEQALTKAKKENKHIFVEGTADWCGPCKLMEKNVLPLDKVGEFYNKHFVFMKWDYDDNSDELMALREKYDFKGEDVGLPGYMVIDTDGEVIFRAGSYIEADTFIIMGKIALGKEEGVIESLERFKAGERDVDFLDRFIDKFTLLFTADYVSSSAQGDYIPFFTEAADSYLSQLQGETRFTAKNLHRMAMLLSMEQSGMARFESVDGFIDNFDRYQAIYKVDPPQLFTPQYKSMAPICMDIMVMRAKQATDKRAALLAELNKAEHPALKEMKQSMGAEKYAATIKSQVPAKAAGADTGIKFHKISFDDALKMGKEKNKLVFVDFYTEWCGPCKAMDNSVFPLPRVGKVFNENFISIKIDGEDEGIDGPALVERYQVEGFPTYLLLNGDGEQVAAAYGYLQPESFIAWANVGLSGMTLAEFEVLETKMRDGDRDPQRVKNYLKLAPLFVNDRIVTKRRTGKYDGFELSVEYQKANELIASVAVEFLDSTTDQQLLTDFAYPLILEHKGSAGRGDRVVEFVFNNFDHYLTLGMSQELAKFIMMSNMMAAMPLAAQGDVKYKNYMNEVNGDYAAVFSKLPEFKPMVANAYDTSLFIGQKGLIDLAYYEARGKWRDYRLLVTYLYERLADHKFFNHNFYDILERFARNCNDVEELKSVEGLMRTVFLEVAAKESEEAGNMFTQFLHMKYLSIYPTYLARIDQRDNGLKTIDKYIELLAAKNGGEKMIAQLKTLRSEI